MGGGLSAVSRDIPGFKDSRLNRGPLAGASEKG